MRCAFTWAVCPAPNNPGRPGQHGADGSVAGGSVAGGGIANGGLANGGLANSNAAGGDVACAVVAPGAVRLLIGDVMGHGPRAAATATAITRQFGEFAARRGPLHEVAERLHDFVARRPGHPSTWGEEFVTAQFVEIPLDDGSPAEMVCCGHPPPLLLRRSGDRAAAATTATTVGTDAPGLPLGLLRPVPPAKARPLPAAAGDALLFYTDGVTEACDQAGRLYPLAERAAALAADPARSAGSLPSRILADLRRYQGELRDDATLLHLEFAHSPSCAVLLTFARPDLVPAVMVPTCRSHAQSREESRRRGPEVTRSWRCPQH
jgi:serine phosphatase RsbU (regulator of sigma subunit)